MLETLALLAVATVIVLGWIYGSRFVCVFLTLPVLAIGMTVAQTNDRAVGIMLLALGVIWLPSIWWWATRRG